MHEAGDDAMEMLSNRGKPESGLDVGNELVVALAHVSNLQDMVAVLWPFNESLLELFEGAHAKLRWLETDCHVSWKRGRHAVCA